MTIDNATSSSTQIVIPFLFASLTCHACISFLFFRSEPEVERKWYEINFIHLFRLTNIVTLWIWGWSSINIRFIKLEKSQQNLLPLCVLRQHIEDRLICLAEKFFMSHKFNVVFLGSVNTCTVWARFGLEKSFCFSIFGFLSVLWILKFFLLKFYLKTCWAFFLSKSVTIKEICKPD